MPAQALAVIATLVSFAPQGNRIALQLDHGSAEMVWVSPTTFHFRRSMNGPLASGAAELKTDPVPLQVEDSPAAVRVRSKYLDVLIAKRGVLLTVRRPDGSAVMTDLSEPQLAVDGIHWERDAKAGVRLYGLGTSAEPVLDWRGKKVDTQIPFLVSSAGYGEFHAGPGPFHFDFTGADRYQIRATQVDYYLYGGPTPKEIFKQHKDAVNYAVSLPVRPQPATWPSLAQQLFEAVHLAMSGDTLPKFDLGPYASADEYLKQRARQLGSLLPSVTPGIIGLTPLRKQLASFFDIYGIEVRDQGRPQWHPLPFQFPNDAESGRHADEFMLGDEMLIAPIFVAGNKRQVYLPPGKWTSLETNQEYTGRQTIPVETAALPVFARNGAIVPLDSDGGIGLHYMPEAGGEFFLLEKEVGQYTQIHAAPAGDVMRLEIESKKERDYQWVVHHVERPTDVSFEDVKYQPVTAMAALKDHTWIYDAGQKNLMLRVHVKAGEDQIVNLSW